MAVSYTHLDVYKRQCPDKRKKVFIRNALCLFDSMLQFGYKDERKVGYYHRMILEIVNGMELDVPDNVRIGSVSYTHLDVYKRQY